MPQSGHASPTTPRLVASRLAGELTAALGSIVRGKPEAIRLSLVALLSGGTSS